MFLIHLLNPLILRLKGEHKEQKNFIVADDFEMIHWGQKKRPQEEEEVFVSGDTKVSMNGSKKKLSL